jgi:OOP family OmpA-OmpF porin
MNKRWTAVSVCLLLLAVALAIPAAAQDIPGSRDNPLVSRYAGSRIIGYVHSDYGALTLGLGKEVHGPKYAKSRHVEGELTRIIYVNPSGTSSLQVFRNYQQALAKAGFKALFTCSGAACGPLFHVVVYPDAKEIHHSQQSEFAFAGVQNQHYLAAELDGSRGTAYVSLYIARDTNDAGVYKGSGRGMTLLEVVKSKTMRTGLVTVNAATMARRIAGSGHIALYGIYFDTDKASIKPKSKATLDQMAKLLKSHPSLKVFIVGHTDNVGSLAHNMALSRRRADAVVQALRRQYGIPAARLIPEGVGPLAPVASNHSSAGRAKNRRVELVEQ